MSKKEAGKAGSADVPADAREGRKVVADEKRIERENATTSPDNYGEKIQNLLRH
jgi:hypothetical protein